MATSKDGNSASAQKDSEIFIAAIDLGTSFSGWAFAPYSDLEQEIKPNIYIKSWYSTYTQFATVKTPTCVLIKPDGQTLDSFGYEKIEKI
ncbi:heat shock 70 kDa protein 12B-like [Ruditapes philippinarum]|uniref:heat shock 70 kDa protein 12B-like n=1 Tax=Ruditapes philippinarum TaxID=129788 RepID=UPI00295B3C94|nr:heat shock 70 kDa protein 12B-like [Ruditapes philippinarum]